VGRRKNVKPKKDLRLPFFGSFFGQAKNEQKSLYQDKESKTDLGNLIRNKNDFKSNKVKTRILLKNHFI